MASRYARSMSGPPKLKTNNAQEVIIEVEIPDLEQDLEGGNIDPSKMTFKRISSWRNFSQEMKRLSFRSVDAISFRSMSRKPKLTRNTSSAQYALQGLRFVNEVTKNANRDQLWKEVEARFNELSRDHGFLARSDFGECIGMKESKEFAMQIFDAHARRRGIERPMITKDELRNIWEDISDPSFDSRMEVFFDMCDTNGDGRVTELEVREIILLSAEENKLTTMKERADEYAALIMEELDREGRGYIELWQLEALMRGQPVADPSQNDYTQSEMLSQVLVPPPRPLQRFGKATKYFLFENWKRIWVLGLWIGIMIGLFTWKFIQYRHRAAFEVMGYCVCVAKGAAETLKLNMALILLPMCRNILTFFRSKMKRVLPLDDNKNFHKIIAGAIVIGILLHGGMHITCDIPRITKVDNVTFNRTIGSDFHYHQPTYWQIVKGVEGITGVVMVVLMIIAFVLATHKFRRNQVKLPWPFHRCTGFNAFWYTHHLFIIVYILLIIHGYFLYFNHKFIQKSTWIYLAIPMILYAGERLWRSFRSSVYQVDIQKVAIYPGNAMALYMSRPPNFKYKSGMYLYIQCPNVSPLEWHPFTITSAPDDNYLSVHIRTKGDWTEQLKDAFSKVCAPPKDNKSGLLRAECMPGDGKSKIEFPKLLIDGPYGAPAQDYSTYDTLLLVGLGIGATPFISVLKDMLNNIKQNHNSAHTNGNASPIRSPTSPPRKAGPKNAYFYWVTREEGSFDWFKGVMNDIAIMDTQAVIELHNHLTSVYQEGDARSALIAMIQSLHHAKKGEDILSGTRVKTHFARPNWRNVLTTMEKHHPGSTIGVFYCGPSPLASELDVLCREYNQRNITRFRFHKENF